MSSGAIAGGRAIATALALVGCGVLLAGCRSAPPEAPPGPHEVRYRLAWSSDGVARVADGSAWEVTNDLGYRIRVTRGWVASYSMELVECPKDSAIERVLAAALLPRSAFAGHLSGTPNPAAIHPAQVESLLDLERRDVGAVTLAPQEYCKVHYLVARAGRESPGLPSEFDMVDVSLHVEGTYRAPDSTADVPFTIHTASAYGQLFERAGVPPAPIRVDTGRTALQVEVLRKLARMFDGVDFAHMTDKNIALQVLRSLVNSAEIRVVPIDAHR